MRKSFILLFLSVLFSLWYNAALASGLSKSVLIGPKAVGMGGAFVAIADDPTAIFHNPAGMTQIEGHQFQLGSDSLITNLDYTPTGGTLEAANAEFLPVPNFGYVTNQFKPVSLGLGVYFPHGNGGKFASPSAAILNPLKGQIYSMEIAPAFAWQIIPELSFGASIRFIRVSSSLEGQLFALPGGGPPDVLNKLSVSGWALGASFGVLYRPVKVFSFGANYRTKVTANLSGSANFAAAGAFTATFGQTLPTLFYTGIALYPLERLTIGLSYSFENNSEIESFDATLNGVIPVSLPQLWQDSHTIHIGGEYWITETIAARVGYARDIVDSIPDTAINRVTGDLEANEISVGGSYKWRRYEFSGTWNARFGSRDVPLTATNPAPGHYEAFVQSLSFGAKMTL